MILPKQNSNVTHFTIHSENFPLKRHGMGRKLLFVFTHAIYLFSLLSQYFQYSTVLCQFQFKVIQFRLNN